MSVRNLLPLESAKILVLQVKVRIVREKALKANSSVLFAALKTFKFGLSYMNCWMCRFCFESNFEKKLLRKGT